MNIAVFVSGNGTNLQAIIEAVSSGELKCKLSVIVSDNKDAYALTRAEKAGIDRVILDPKKFKTREDFDREAIKELEKRKIDLVILAGFMRLLSDSFIKKYKNRIMNIHPALLPSFKGTHGIKDAFEYGAKVTGVTVHFVDEKLDNGPIILQEAVELKENESMEGLEEKMHQLEHKLYPKAIKLFLDGKLDIAGRKVKVKG